MSKMFPVSTPSSSEWLCTHDLLSWKFPLSIGSYTLVGRSRAADATSLYIPELDTFLDCGCLPTVARPMYVFLTHTHSDHCLDVTRIVSKTRPPQIYLPLSGVQPMQDYIEKCHILRSAGRLENPDPTTWIPNHVLIGVQADELLTFRKTMKVRVFDMDHSVPCCGYGFYESRFKLKNEYKHLTSTQIGQLKRANQNLELNEEKLVPLFAFMGDTTASIFQRYSNELFQFPLIIIECTFIDNENHAQRAADVKHVLWDDLQPFVLQHPDITFVLIHFSQQYKSEQIRDFFQKLNLPNVIPFI